MPGHVTALYFRWPISNADHVWDLAAAFTLGTARPSHCAPCPQAFTQVTAQAATAFDIQLPVDRFVTHTHLRIIREVDSQPVRYLLGTMFLLQMIRHLLKESLIAGKLGGARAAGTPVSTFLPRRCPVLRQAPVLKRRGVQLQFPADR